MDQAISALLSQPRIVLYQRLALRLRGGKAGCEESEESMGDDFGEAIVFGFMLLVFGLLFVSTIQTLHSIRSACDAIERIATVLEERK